jgi:hypothetical protein
MSCEILGRKIRKAAKWLPDGSTSLSDLRLKPPSIGPSYHDIRWRVDYCPDPTRTASSGFVYLVSFQTYLGDLYHCSPPWTSAPLSEKRRSSWPLLVLGVRCLRASAESRIRAANAWSVVTDQEELARGLVSILSAGLPRAHDADLRHAVSQHALHLVVLIHERALHAQGQGQDAVAEIIRTVYALLDVIDLLAILPTLSPGVMLRPEHQRKSVLLPDLVAGCLQRPPPRDAQLLATVIDGLHRIIKDGERGISALLRDRILTDFVCGVAEVAFSPAVDQNIRESHTFLWQEVLDM